ncbi:MAG: hypothetical protein A2Z18_08575 [Armatimonadetes bacterium RBG_16_58_9]|nr:MAG: hypothetical protein A2Z18_08575 [Armatimonadetes bacterium RBG_16_58_9]
MTYLKTSGIDILPVNIAILAVGIVDLSTTLFWVRTGQATELNPIMAAFLGAGTLPFVLAKLCTLAAYVTVTEWYRRKRGAGFARMAGNFTVTAYLSIYAVSFASVNSHLFAG